MAVVVPPQQQDSVVEALQSYTTYVRLLTITIAAITVDIPPTVF